MPDLGAGETQIEQSDKEIASWRLNIGKSKPNLLSQFSIWKPKWGDDLMI